MGLKTFLGLVACLFLFFQVSASEVSASEVSPQDLTVSDDIYADLALRHELDHVGVYYFDDNIANTVSLNAEKAWDPASTIKLYVAMYVFDQVASGNISLDKLVTIQDKNEVPSQSFPNGYSPLAVGDTVSVYELLDRMITQSGNVSYNTLLDLLDRRQVTKYVHDLGLVNSSVGAKLNLDDLQRAQDEATPGFGPNTTNADDYATAFILINGKRIPGAASLFDMLARQKFNSMLPALLPKDVVVAHKTGELDPFYHDGGIVVGKDRKYILSIFSDAGDPNLLAHLSYLIYTRDSNLIGNDISKKDLSEEEPNAPIDPLVASGNIQANVLALSTQNIKIPSISAADIGVQTSDLASSLASSQLPKVIIPNDSRFHFLVNLGDKITSFLSPTPSLKVISETGKLKLKLAEANDLIERGKKDEAKNILKEVDARLVGLAKETVVSETPNLQKIIDQVSETRFSLLGKELASAGKGERAATIKEIANQARNTSKNVEPYIKDAIKNKDLSQKPTVGEVVARTPFSITLRAEDGQAQVTAQVDPQIKTRKEGEANVKVENVADIPLGAKVAIVGSFVLKDVPNELVNSKPGTVLKVNKALNTLVSVSEKGIPVQADLTKKSVIKGNDTSVSLGEVKKGDIIVVRGVPLTPPPSATKPSQVIKANVIQVVEKASDIKASKPKEEKKSESKPMPPATIPSKEEKKK